MVGALESIYSYMDRVGLYPNETLALHILNVAHTINIIQSCQSPIYMAALWLDNIVLNVLAETILDLNNIPVFMFDTDERILYIVNHSIAHPLLILRANSILDIWKEDDPSIDTYENLIVANIWYKQHQTLERIFSI